MRIGVRLETGTAHGALTAGGRVLAAASAPLAGAPADALGGLLRDLAAHAPYDIASVTWDAAAVLRAALERAADDRTAAGCEPGTGAAGPAGSPRARPVAAVRVVPRPPAAPTLGGHPAPLVRSLVAWRETVTGGHDLFGTELAALDLEAARRHARAAESAGLRTVAVTATGAGGCPAHEQAVAEQLLKEFPGLRVCPSYEVGGLGLLEREATTVINAALLDVAEEVIAWCEQATAALHAPASCWFATGDGGRVSAKRLRWLPVIGLAATGAMGLLGAATLAGTQDAMVALAGAAQIATGQVREGLPHVESDLPGGMGVRVTAPQPALTLHPADAADTAAALLAEQAPGTPGVVAALEAGGEEAAERVGKGAGGSAKLVRSEADVAAVGAACAEVSAWLDLLAVAATPADLDKVHEQAEQQALVQVAANGAAPGSERIVKSAATPMYLTIGLYRVRVRASSSHTAGGE